MTIQDWPKRWTWANLRIASAVQERLRRRLTPAGQTVLAATLSAGLFGIDTRMTAAHQAFALGAALLTVAWLATLRPPRGLRATRHLPRQASAGTPVHYRVTLHNTGKRALRGLELCERLPDPRPSRRAFLGTVAPSESRLNPLERLFGYPRWEWLLHRARMSEPQRPTPVPAIDPGAQLTQTLVLTPARRGWLRLDELAAARVDPLGLMRKERAVAGSARLLVLPRRYPVRPPAPPGRRRLQPGGVAASASVGDSKEFIGLRDYLPGDSPRHIHWAAWARCGEPVVKEYQDEYFSRQALVLDSFIGADGDRADAFECAVSVAASMIEPLTARGAADALLDLMFVADRAHTLTGGRGLRSSESMLSILACLDPHRSDDFATLGATVGAHAPQLSACVCVLLAWDADRRGLVERLRQYGVPVRVLVIGTETDLADAPEGREAGEAADLFTRVDPADPGEALRLFGDAGT
jgi:uncharacterized protein (DUF58 family)